MKNGVGIHLGQMNNITIVDEGQAAVIEGGVINGDLLSYLWTRGKQTMTTSCDCVGYISPILGGGHGWLQGRYGLAADQLLSARLVLANGTVITVSTGQNPDLFWAIRGAGHNFGIVTQAKLRIYDVEPTQQWVTGNFVFTQDKLEALFILANEVLDRTDRPADMNYWLTFASNPAVDREQASSRTSHVGGTLADEVIPSSRCGYTTKAPRFHPNTRIRFTCFLQLPWPPASLTSLD